MNSLRPMAPLALLAFLFIETPLFAQTEEPKQAQESLNEDSVDLYMSLLNFDPVRGELDVRTTVTPNGKLATEEGTPAVPMRLVDVESVSSSELELPKGRQIPTLSSRYESEGDVSAYPFDTHEVALGMYMTEGGKGDDAEEIEAELEIELNIPGFSVSAQPTKENDSTFASQTLTITRSQPVIIFSIVVMGIMWILAIIVLSMAFAIFKNDKMPETGALGFMAALLFAFPAIRNAQPNVPPFGTYSDFISFFWAELIVVLSLLIVGACWLKRYRR